MRIAITGTTGFLGSHLIEKLRPQAALIRAIVRCEQPSLSGVEQFLIEDMNSQTQYMDSLNDVDCVIHCAARVHIMKDDSKSPLEAYREVNTQGTLNLAHQAAQAGVKRFLFLSSIKVNGESTTTKPYTAEDIPSPEDPYGISKFEAEQKLLELAKTSEMEIVIIRSPLVYGPGVKANFLSLMKFVNSNIPIPLGAVTQNKRSLVSVDNLIDFIQVCLEHPLAGNQIFLVSDGQDLSTVELIKEIGLAMGKIPYLMPFPKFCFDLLGFVLRKKSITARIFGSLQVDISKNSKLLGWAPPFTTKESMNKTVNYYLSNSKA